MNNKITNMATVFLTITIIIYAFNNNATASSALPESNNDIQINNVSINHPEIYSPLYVDPIRKQVINMRAKGMNNSQIVQQLKDQNIVYWPEQDEWAMGTEFTPNEYNAFQIHVNNSYKQYGIQPHFTNTQVVNPLNTYNQVDDMLKTADIDFSYSGWAAGGKPGTLGIGTSETNGSFQHQWTTHLGSQGTVIEVGVIRIATDPNKVYSVYTCQGNVDGNQPVHYTTVNSEDWHTYEILVTANHYSQGYLYYVYMDGIQIRSGYLNSLYNQVTQNNENVKDTQSLTYSTDTSHSAYKMQYLAKSGTSNFFPWNSTLPKDTYPDNYATYPQQQVINDQWYNPHSWYHEGWTQY